MFNVWAPSGDFDTGQLANPGLGYWTFEPMLAFRWLSTKIGTEFSVFIGSGLQHDKQHLRLSIGRYFPRGRYFGAASAVVWRFAGAGASAFYLKQITGDSGSGARLGSFETESYGVGPTVSYVHKIGNSELIVDGSWLPQLHTVNTTKGNFFWAKITVTF